jgi:Fe-S oxidoreductase
MNYHPFILPFTIGLYGLILVLAFLFSRWIITLPRDEKKKLSRYVFSYRIFGIIGEVIMEVLLHRRIFRKNAVLGYMHMSIAFGWFLLIVGGTIESKMHSHQAFNEPWIPIFYKYFVHNNTDFRYAEAFAFVMDLLLLFVLSGVALAFFKRMRSRFFGMKKTTRQLLPDKFALGALWLIFPLRLVAESVTAALHSNGGFLTGTMGDIMASSFSLSVLQHAEINLWWAYSIALFTFFALLPFTRYMHIPTEAFHIALKKSGLKPLKSGDGITRFQTHSCSRCGVCIDSCQLNAHLNRNQMLPVTFFYGERTHKPGNKEVYDCLMCGKCTVSCPVGLDINAVRQNRRNLMSGTSGGDYAYLPGITEEKKTEVVYFAGCMTHLNPAIKKSMETLLNKAGVNWVFLDKDESICCGRPIKLSGKTKDAEELMKWNREKILSYGPSVLVTSCPICYKTFAEDYHLPVRVLHHSQYLKMLIETGKLKPRKTGQKFSYHDPCDLGRLSGIYEEPRFVVRSVGSITRTKDSRDKALCCGSSLAHFHGSDLDRVILAEEALEVLCRDQPDKLVTACPLCLKAFNRVAEIPVADIATIVEEALEEGT